MEKYQNRIKQSETDFNSGRVSDNDDSYDYYSENEQLSTALNETADSPSPIHKLKTKKSYTGKDGETRQTKSTYENQRYWLYRFNDTLFPTERAAWSDLTGQVYLPKENVPLPGENW